MNNKCVGCGEEIPILGRRDLGKVHIHKQQVLTLAELITNSEKRLLSHKLTLKEMSIDRDTYPPLDELVIWLKEFIREEKNSEQRWLKMLVEEKTAENEGLNPNYKIVL